MPGLEGLLDRELVGRSSVLGDGLAHGEAPLAGSGWRVSHGRRGSSGADARTPARFRTGVRIATDHSSGSSLSDDLRRGGAATTTVDHCTSPPFVHIDPTRCGARVQAGGSCGGRGLKRAAPTPTRRGRTTSDPSGSSPSTLRPASSTGSSPGLAGASVTTTSGHDALAVDPRLVRRQPLGDREAEAAAVVLELRPLLDRALAERLGADEGRPSAVVERAGDDLGRGRRPAVDEERRAGSTGRWRRPPGLAAVSVRLPSASCCQKTVPVGEELAGDLAGRGDEPARVAAQVDDELAARRAPTPPATASSNSPGGAIGEPGELDVADLAAGERVRLDLGLDDDRAHDLDVERRARPAPDPQRDRRVLGAADLAPRLRRR